MNDTPEAMLARLQEKLRHAEALIAELGTNQADALSMLVRTNVAFRGEAETPEEQRTMRYRQVDMATARGMFHLAVAQQMEILSDIYTLTGEEKIADQSELLSAEHFNYGYEAMAIASRGDQDPAFHFNWSKANEYAAKAIRLRAHKDAILPAEIAAQIERAQHHEAEAERHMGIFNYLEGREDDGGLSK